MKRKTIKRLIGTAVMIGLTAIAFDIYSPKVKTIDIVPEVEEEVTHVAVSTIDHVEPIEIFVEVQPEEPTEPEPTYTDEELEILAIIIYQEAGSDACSDETRLMVGNVFLNRVASNRYPDTFAEVATQKQQYGRLYWTGLRWPERAVNKGEAHAVDRAYDIAKRLLEGERVLPEDVIFQSEYIQGEIVAQSDGFYFCR